MGITKTGLKELIEAIHATPYFLVFEFAGAGAQALSWLHTVGGSSGTILEAADRYAASSLQELIEFEPKSVTSPSVARAMATQALLRAAKLAQAGTPILGIGCTATIATNRQKRGDHRCCVSVCDASGITTYALTLTKGVRTREQEEELVSLIVLRAIANACGLSGQPPLPLKDNEQLATTVEPVGLLERLTAEEVEIVTVTSQGHMVPARQIPNIALLSGAFNPLHQGHRRLAEVATEILGQPIYFELPVINADKAGIGPEEVRRRLEQFEDFAPLILTAAPLFLQKAEIFPHSVFILGVDTAQRLIEPRFYQHDPAKMLEALAQIRHAGCRFLVANRMQDGQFLTLRDLAIPTGFTELFEEIPTEKFRVDISSTVIRENETDA